MRVIERAIDHWPHLFIEQKALHGDLASRRLYIELTVVEIGAFESRWDAVEAAGARGISVGARA